MLLYCLKCNKNKESKNPRLDKTKNVRIMLILNCAVCNCKKPKFVKEEESRGSLSSLGRRTPLSQVAIFGPTLF